MRFESISQGIGNDFVYNITKTNRPEILREDRIRVFLD
jgi:hypothetical protein